MKKTTLILLFISSIVTAQYSETISSGRPGQAVSAFAVGKNVFQIQAGLDYTKSQHWIPNSFFRFGITENVELNSGVVYNNRDIESLSLGSRIHFSSGDEASTYSGIQVSFSSDTEFENPTSTILFIAEKSLTEKLTGTINIGASIDLNSNKNGYAGIYVLNFSYSINDKINVFFEPYGTITDSDFRLNIDGGMSYLVNNNLQLDFLVGQGIVKDEDYMVSGGISWRFLTKPRKPKK